MSINININSNIPRSRLLSVNVLTHSVVPIGNLLPSRPPLFPPTFFRGLSLSIHQFLDHIYPTIYPVSHPSIPSFSIFSVLPCFPLLGIPPASLAYQNSLAAFSFSTRSMSSTFSSSSSPHSRKSTLQHKTKTTQVKSDQQTVSIHTYMQHLSHFFSIASFLTCCCCCCCVSCWVAFVLLFLLIFPGW